MKRLFLIAIIFVIGILFIKVQFFPANSNIVVKKTAKTQPTAPPAGGPTSTPKPQKPVTSLFVPYWTIGTQTINDSNYNELIYFGIQANTTGIDTAEDGYLDMPKFLAGTDAAKTRLLAVRMIDTTVNNKVLTDKSAQQKIIADSVKIAKQNNFNGIVLDFEISALSFDSVVKNISGFEQSFDEQVKNNHLTFDVLIYGDNFFRFRPFDVKTISIHSDKIFIMAYDFSKAGGSNPGPNFPLYGKEVYGYDFTNLVADFQKQAPSNKLSIIYGMYGYNWNVDNNNKSEGLAQSLTDQQITQLFYPTCNETACVVKKDEQSAETEITYQDHDGQKHTLWFENINSAGKKQEYAKSKGITNAAYWAYSYF